MKKKLVTLLLSAAATLCLAFGLAACGETKPDGSSATEENQDAKGTEGLDYYLLDDDTYAVDAGKATLLSEIIIPAKYNNKAVTTIKKDGFDACSNMTSVTIPDSITSIGDWAFYNCKKLTNIFYTGNIAGWCSISGVGGLMYGSNNKTLYIGGNKVEDLVL